MEYPNSPLQLIFGKGVKRQGNSDEGGEAPGDDDDTPLHQATPEQLRAIIKKRREADLASKETSNTKELADENDDSVQAEGQEKRYEGKKWRSLNGVRG